MDDVDEAFDDLMSRSGTGLVIVTTAVGDERSGCLVGFHGQCSIEPRRYCTWISKVNHTFGLVTRADALAVHILTTGSADRELARLFGGETGDEVDKFERCAWTPGPHGVPLLDGLEVFVGRRTDVVDPGTDHAGVIVRPIAVRPATRAGGDLPLLTLADVDDLEPGHPAGG